jgi:hypothetical protein
MNLSSGLSMVKRNTYNHYQHRFIPQFVTSKGVFIIYTGGWYRREMGWVRHFSGV